jgi:hypothetical protein
VTQLSVILSSPVARAELGQLVLKFPSCLNIVLSLHVSFRCLIDAMAPFDPPPGPVLIVPRNAPTEIAADSSWQDVIKTVDLNPQSSRQHVRSPLPCLVE